jgi:hypothetical protein
VCNAAGEVLPFDGDWQMEQGGEAGVIDEHTPDKISALAEMIRERFEKEGPSHLMREGEMFLENIAEYAVASKETASDIDDTIYWHVIQTSEFLSERFGLEDPPMISSRRDHLAQTPLSQMEKADLKRVIKAAMTFLLPQHRTYAKVHPILRGLYGSNAPETHEALRKLLERAGLDWKELKAEVLES